MKRKSISGDTTIRDLLDVIHWTIIDKEGENEKCMHELSSIDNKIQSNRIENYKVSETTFWQSLSGYKKGTTMWIFHNTELLVYIGSVLLIGFVIGLLI